MSAKKLPDIAHGGIGNEHRQGRKPPINRRFDTAIAHVADKRPIKSDLDSSKGNGHAYIRARRIYRKNGQVGQSKKEIGMREKTLERKLVQVVKAAGGVAPKFISPGYDGMPDRLLLLPGGRIAFVEVKAPGKAMRPLQIKRKRQLEALGFRVYCLDDAGQIGGILGEIQPS